MSEKESAWNIGAKYLDAELKFIGVNEKKIEIEKIEFLSQRKYNRYDQYLPGETFQNRLILWLENFSKEDRFIAMEIVKNLVYYDIHELRSLSLRAFHLSLKIIENEIIFKRQRLLRVYLNNKKVELERNLERTLYIAIADDVMFDFFRRQAQKRFSVLHKDNFIEYYKLHDHYQNHDVNYLKDYDRIFFVDQLCASGMTLIRQNEHGNWKGKVNGIYHIWKNVDTKNLYYLPYIMSIVAKTNITRKISLWRKHNKIKNNISICPTHLLPISDCLSSGRKEKIDSNKPVSKLCEKYYDQDIVHKHTSIGGSCMYGFGEAGLILILNTNCPNNTIPLIWNRNNDWIPLFPRIEHHNE